MAMLVYRRVLVGPCLIKHCWLEFHVTKGFRYPQMEVLYLIRLFEGVRIPSHRQ